MGDDITIGVTEIVNNIEVTAQPNDQIVDISVIDNADEVTLNITPTVIEINVNKGSSYARWGTIYGNLTDQTDLTNALILKADLVDGKVPAYQLPSFVDDVVEVANYAALPAMGEIGKIYVTLDNNKIYRWSGSVYIEIASNNAIWGAITGTLSNQTDLQNALNTKALKTTTISTTSPLFGGGDLSGDLTLFIQEANSVSSGYLTYTDWRTFNGKANDNAVVHLAGNETITGQKTFNNSSNSISIYSNNTSVGTGIYSDNSGIGTGIQSINSSSGLGFYSQNTSTGKGIQSNNTSTGRGIYSQNTSTGRGIDSQNTSTGIGIYSNNASTGTGFYSSNSASGSGIFSTNNSTGNAIYAENLSTGIGIYSVNASTGKGFESINSSTGQGFLSYNSGLGTGIYSSNAAAGKGIESYNSSTGTGFYSNNSAGGIALYSNNESSGRNLLLNNTTTATGMPFTIQKQGVDKFTINDAGGVYAAGSVGIGTTSPAAKLSVNGDLFLTTTGRSITFNSDTNLNTQIYEISGSINLYTGGQDRLRITSGGNVGIGTTSPQVKLHTAREDSGEVARFSAPNGSIPHILIGRPDATTEGLKLSYDSNTGNTSFETVAAHNMLFKNNNTERMRITSGGFTKISNTGSYYGVGGTYHEFNNNASDAILRCVNSSSSPYGVSVYFTNADPNNTSLYIYNGYSSYSGTSLYTIWSNGTTSGRSDARLKKNIVDSTPKLDKLLKLRVVNYEWKENIGGSKELGLIAQEVEEIFPNLIITSPIVKEREVILEDGTIEMEKYEDGDYKSLKNSVLPYITIKALQELAEQVKELKAEIELLKAN